MPYPEEKPFANRPVLRLLFGNVDYHGENKTVPKLLGAATKLFGVEGRKIQSFLESPTGIFGETHGNGLVSRLLNTVADYAAELEPQSRFGRLRNEIKFVNNAQKGDLDGMQKILDIYAGDEVMVKNMAREVVCSAQFKHLEYPEFAIPLKSLSMVLPLAPERAKAELFIFSRDVDQLTELARQGIDQRTKDIALNKKSPSWDAAVSLKLLELGADPFVKRPLGGPRSGLSHGSFFEGCAYAASGGAGARCVAPSRQMLDTIRVRDPERSRQALVVYEADWSASAKRTGASPGI